MKTCSKCRQSLPLLDFAKHSRNADGLQATCRACSADYRKARTARDRASAPILPHDEGKACSRCREFKPWSAYAKNRSTRDGRQTQCRTCTATTQREYFERNAEAVALRYAERLARTPDTGTKICRKCGETKPLLSFYAHRSTKDRRANYCMECQQATTRQWQKANAEKVRANNAARGAEMKSRDRREWLLKLYNLTPAQYDELLAAQDGACAICLLPERYVDARTGRPRRLAVDHDHQTGLVRGLLCGRCNRSIGQFDHDPERLARASRYLREAALM